MEKNYLSQFFSNATVSFIKTQTHFHIVILTTPLILFDISFSVGYVFGIIHARHKCCISTPGWFLRSFSSIDQTIEHTKEEIPKFTLNRLTSVLLVLSLRCKIAIPISQNSTSDIFFSSIFWYGICDKFILNIKIEVLNFNVSFIHVHTVCTTLWINIVNLSRLYLMSLLMVRK